MIFYLNVIFANWVAVSMNQIFVTLSAGECEAKICKYSSKEVDKGGEMANFPFYANTNEYKKNQFEHKFDTFDFEFPQERLEN